MTPKDSPLAMKLLCFFFGHEWFYGESDQITVEDGELRRLKRRTCKRCFYDEITESEKPIIGIALPK